MRFLDTTTVALVDVALIIAPTRGGRIEPLYAILSHTWGKGEVSFKDMQPENRDRAKELEGYSKLGQACKRARVDGYKYIWVDTCCIDKTSSAELTEAINSMYEYYCTADVCYAYLTGVDSKEDPRGEESKFRTCRWFNRAWTLQELLAPLKVIFYAEDWKEIGTKSSLLKVISAFAGIPSKVLWDPTCREEFSIAQRMSWAAGREATRVEDIAYSLMGLFDVNMPTMYGEGDKAFFRLQLEIMASSNDQSIFAWRARPLSFGGRGLLANSPDEFATCGQIVTHSGTSRSASESPPYSMTNRGLHIQLPVFPWHSDKNEVTSITTAQSEIALLDCLDDSENKQFPVQVGIVIRKFGTENKSAYERIRCDQRHTITDVPRDRIQVQEMFFKQCRRGDVRANRYWLMIPSRRANRAIVINRLPYAGFSIVETWPDYFCTYQDDRRLRITIPGVDCVALRFEHMKTKQMFIVMIGHIGDRAWVDIVTHKKMVGRSIDEVRDSFKNIATYISRLDRVTKGIVDPDISQLRRSVSVTLCRKTSDPFAACYFYAYITIHDHEDTLPPGVFRWKVDIKELSGVLFFLQHACPPEDWRSNANDEMVLKLEPPRPSCAVLVFQRHGAKEKFAVVFGINEGEFWTSVVADLGENSADNIRRSHLEGGSRAEDRKGANKYKASIWDGISICMETEGCGERSFVTKITVLD